LSTADLIAAASPRPFPPAWRQDAISVRIDGGDLAKAAAEIDRHAADQGFTVAEVVRVERDGADVIYARGAVPGVAKSEELGRFLDKAITETKTPAMNKFAELAAKIKAGQTEMDQEADSLSAEVDTTLTAFREAANQHRSMLSAARDGVKAMQEAVSGLIGHNGSPA
jgi:hypothetical protein